MYGRAGLRVSRGLWEPPAPLDSDSLHGLFAMSKAVADPVDGVDQKDGEEAGEDGPEVDQEDGGLVDENGGEVGTRGEGTHKPRRESAIDLDDLLKFYSFQAPYGLESKTNFLTCYRAEARSSGKKKVPTENECRKLAAKHFREAPSKYKEIKDAESTVVCAEANFEKKLRDVCAQRGLDYTESRAIFDNKGGTGAKLWNYWRELAHRDEFTTKLRSSGIRVDDPLCAVFCNFANYSNPANPVVTISVAEFICSDLVKRTRGIQSRSSGKAAQAGTSGYSTKAFHDTGYQAQVGRFAKVGNEKVPEGGAEWEPVQWETMEKLLPATNAFDLWFKAKLVKKDKSNKFTNIERSYRVARGELGARPPEKARPGQKRNRNEKDPGGNARDRTIMSTSWHTFGLSSSVEEDTALMEEFHALADIWQHFGLTNTGVFKACLDWGHHLVNMFFDTDALVISCDHMYEPQDGTRFRTLDEQKSFLNGDVLTMVSDGMKESHGTVGMDSNGLNIKTYRFADEAYIMQPYAAVYNAYKQLLHVDFRSLYLYYPELYNRVKRLLLDWNENRIRYGCSPEDVMRRTQDLTDVIYGDKLTTVLAEPPPYLVRGDGSKRLNKLWRLRPPAPGEEMPWHQALPDGEPEPTKYPLVAELRIESDDASTETDWAMWCMGTFWQQDQTTKSWERCPQDDLGHFHEVGWVHCEQSLNEAICSVERAGE